MLNKLKLSAFSPAGRNGGRAFKALPILGIKTAKCVSLRAGQTTTWHPLGFRDFPDPIKRAPSTLAADDDYRAGP